MKPLWILLLALLVLASRCGLITTIQPLEVGVVVDPLTGTLSEPLMPGTHLVSPFYAVVIYPTSTQQLTVCCSDRDAYNAVSVRFADGLEATIDATILFAVNPQQVNTLHVRWRDRYIDEFVLPTIRTAIQEVAARYTAEAILISSPRPEAFESDIRQLIIQRLSEEGFTHIDFLLRDIAFSEESMLTLEPLVLTLEPFYVATVNAMLTATAPPP